MSLTFKGAFNNDLSKGRSPCSMAGATNCCFNLVSALAHGGTLAQGGPQLPDPNPIFSTLSRSVKHSEAQLPHL